MARPQTPHVPSCRLKSAHPSLSLLISFCVRAENTREILRVYEDGANRDQVWVCKMGDDDGSVVMARGKINSRTCPGSDMRPTATVSLGSTLSSGIRRYSVTRSPSNFADYVVLKARRDRTWSTSSISAQHVESAIMYISAHLSQEILAFYDCHFMCFEMFVWKRKKNSTLCYVI